VAIIDGHIRCSRCRLDKPVTEYAPSAVKNGCGNCRVCQQLYTRAYQKANPEKSRAYGRASYQRNLEAARKKSREKQVARRAANPEAGREYQRSWMAKAADESLSKYEESRATWRKRNPERLRAYDLAKYDLTPADYDAMLAAQGGACACCGATANANGKRLFVDHDHSTGAVRGILCHHCNSGIGHFKDSPALLRGAIAYLKRAQQPLPSVAPTIRINLMQGAN